MTRRPFDTFHEAIKFRSVSVVFQIHRLLNNFTTKQLHFTENLNITRRFDPVPRTITARFCDSKNRMFQFREHQGFHTFVKILAFFQPQSQQQFAFPFMERHRLHLAFDNTITLRFSHKHSTRTRNDWNHNHERFRNGVTFGVFDRFEINIPVSPLSRCGIRPDHTSHDFIDFSDNFVLIVNLHPAHPPVTYPVVIMTTASVRQRRNIHSKFARLVRNLISNRATGLQGDVLDVTRLIKTPSTGFSFDKLTTMASQCSFISIINFLFPFYYPFDNRDWFAWVYAFHLGRTREV